MSAAPVAFDASALDASSVLPREGALPLLFAAATHHRHRAQEETQPQVHARVLRRAGGAGRHPPAAAGAPDAGEREASEPFAPPFPGARRVGEGAVLVRRDVPRRARGGGREPRAVLTACGAVATTGSNAYGQLGLGDARRRYAFERVESLAARGWRTVAVGEDHSAAVAEDGRRALWGRGDWGQLGTGDARSHFAPRLVAGVSVAPPVAPEKFLGFRGGAPGLLGERRRRGPAAGDGRREPTRRRRPSRRDGVRVVFRRRFFAFLLFFVIESV